MKSYSQNREDLMILEYFNKSVLKDQPCDLLDIGANDGVTFSNSRLLIEQGWSADLVEPSPTAFSKLHTLYSGNEKVHLYPIALGVQDGYDILHESGAHVPGGDDIALVSSLYPQETERWRSAGVEFKSVPVTLMTFETFIRYRKRVSGFDFISIDAEGMDLAILQQ